MHEIRRATIVVVNVLLACGLVACGQEPSARPGLTAAQAEKASPGEDGRLLFLYETGACGSSGCPVETGLMVGTDEVLAIHAADERAPLPTGLVVESSDPSLVRAELLPYEGPTSERELRRVRRVLVRARRQGEVEIVVKTRDGQVVDRARVQARRAARIPGWGSPEAPGAALHLDDRHPSAPFWIAVEDAQGRALLASAGFTLRVDDPSVATLIVDDEDADDDEETARRLLFGPRLSSGDRLVDAADAPMGAALSAVGRGETRLVVHAGDAEAWLPVVVDSVPAR